MGKKKLQKRVNDLKVIVKKCDNPNFWYSEYIGRQFRVLKITCDGVEPQFLTDGNDYSGLISACDCNVVINDQQYAWVPQAIEVTEIAQAKPEAEREV
jgi:hypothetical protein